MLVWNICITLLFSLLLIGFREISKTFLGIAEIPAGVSLGFILLASYSFGRAISYFKLPRLNGYLFLGILAGPYFLNLISQSSIQQLKLIDSVALVFIALTAGGELKVSFIRQNLKAYVTILCITIPVMVVGTTSSFFGFE